MQKCWALFCFPGTTPGGTMRRSTSNSSQLSQSALVSPSAREASRSAGNLTHYGTDLRDQDKVGSVRSFRSTPGDYGNMPSVHRDRRRSEGDAIDPQIPVLYSDITLERGENEGFGFVILSSVHKSGSTIGKLLSHNLMLNLFCSWGFGWEKGTRLKYYAINRVSQHPI